MARRNARFLLPCCTVCFLINPVVSRAQWLSDGNPVCTVAGDQIPASRPVSDGAGGAIMVWADGRTGSSEIYAQRVKSTGAMLWAPNGVQVTATLNNRYPEVVSDGAGGAIIFWTRGIDPATDIYAQRVNSAGVNQWTASGVLICGAPNRQYVADAVADGAGGAIVTWTDDRQGLSDVFAQRVNASGVAQWTSDGVAVCTAANLQTYVELVGDGSGGAIMAWLDGRGSPYPYAFYARRVNAAGVPQWTADGVALSTNTYDEESNQPPAIATDGSGGAVVAFQVPKPGSGEADIRAQRVTSSGSTLWAAGGVPICAAVYPQWMPQIISDGDGGAIVAWLDERNLVVLPPPLTSDIYAQRVNASGVAQWTPDGVPLCTTSAGSFLPDMIADGAGGSVVCWHDSRNGSPDIYAQRIDAGGVTLWTTDGVLLSAAPSTQFSPRMASDGFGGAIVAWRDYRAGGTSDLYATRVTRGGTIPTGVGATPALPLITGNNYPNPFSNTTAMDITVDSATDVAVEIFDVAGRRVRAINVGRVRAGTSPIHIDGRDQRGRLLASGLYFCRIRAGDATATRKVVIQR